MALAAGLVHGIGMGTASVVMPASIAMFAQQWIWRSFVEILRDAGRRDGFTFAENKNEQGCARPAAQAAGLARMIL
jgi:hypothetical protein